MGLSNAQLLVGVNFLHFVSSGLIAPVLVPHIVSNGGNHILLGLLIAALFICSKISKHLLTFFNDDNKSLVKFCLLSSLITYLMLIIDKNPWLTFFNRCFYVLTNQISFLSKDYVAKSTTKGAKTDGLNLFEVIEVGGISLGAISGGYIFELIRDFRVVAVTASITTLLAILLVRQIDNDTPTSRTSNLLSVTSTWNAKIQNLKSIDYANKWVKFLMVSTYFLSASIYFSRFPFLVTSNYHVNATIIGCTIAFQFTGKFFSDRAAPYIKNQITDKNSLFEFCLLICGLILGGIYYIPSYEIYLILFVPMIIANSLINSFLGDDVLELKNGDAVESITILIHIFIPISFGFLCHIYGAKAFQYLLVLPVVVCVYLAKQRSERGQKENDQDKEKEE